MSSNIKFSAESKALDEILSKAVKMLSDKPVIQALSNLKIVVNPSGLMTITASDLINEGTFQLLITTNTEESLEFLVPGVMLAEMIKKLPTGTIKFSFDSEKNTLNIAGSKGRYNLRCLNADYPSMEKVEFTTHFKINPSFLETIKSVFYAIDPDPTKGVVAGINVRISENKPVVFGVQPNGGALAKLTELDAVISEGDEIQTEFNLPLELTKKIISFSEALNDLDIALNADCSVISVSSDSWQIIARLLDGKYPNVQQIVDANKAIPIALEVELDRKELLAALDRLIVLRDKKERYHMVYLSVNEDKTGIELHSNSKELGDANDAIEAFKISGDLSEPWPCNVYILIEVLKMLKIEIVPISILKAAQMRIEIPGQIHILAGMKEKK